MTRPFLPRRSHPIARLLAGAGVVACSALVGVSTAPPAAAGTASGQAAYACEMMFEGQQNTSVADQEYEDPTTVALSLEVPDKVAPGQSVSLRGTLSLQFSEYLSTTSNGYFDQFEGYSDTFSVAVTMGGKTIIVKGDRWQTPRLARTNPIVARAPITFESFVVPAGTTGSVHIGLPQNNVTKNTAYGTPPIVAFTGRARASGSFGTYNYELGCYLPRATPGTVANIPVTAAAAQGTGKTKSGTKGQASAVPTAPAAVPGATTAPGASAAPTAPDAGADLPADAESLAAAAQSAATGDPFAAPAADGSTASMTTTSASTDDRSGVYVSGGLLVTVAVLLCLLGLGAALWSQQRMRALKRTLDS